MDKAEELSEKKESEVIEVCDVRKVSARVQAWAKANISPSKTEDLWPRPIADLKTTLPQ